MVLAACSSTSSAPASGPDLGASNTSIPSPRAESDDGAEPDRLGAEATRPPVDDTAIGVVSLGAEGPFVAGGTVPVDIADDVLYVDSWRFDQVNVDGVWEPTHFVHAEPGPAVKIVQGELLTHQDGPALFGPATVTLALPDDAVEGRAQVCLRSAPVPSCVRFEIT